MLKALGSRLTYANVMATVAVFLALGGGAYALTGIPDRSGVYHGCVDPKAGALRVVKGASSCRKTKTVTRGGRRVRIPGESAIAWSQKGPMGAQGIAGIQGKQGDVGARGPSDAFHRAGAMGMTLAAGDYIVIAKEEFDSGLGSPTAGVLNMSLFTPGGTVDSSSQSYPASGSATTTLVSSVHLGAAGVVSVGSTAAGTGNFSHPQLTAIQVGALHES